MRLDAVMLADHAAVAESKLYIHGGGITRFQVPVLPFAIPALSVILRFKTEPDDLGEHSVLVEFTNPDGVQVLPSDPAPISLEASGATVDGEESFTQMVMAFSGLPILAVGLHTFRISWDDEVLREFTIPVNLIDQAPGATPNRAERRRQERAAK